MIVVTGATGKLGRAIILSLVGRVAPGTVAASVRDPSKAGDLQAIGIRVRRGDFADPDCLPHAFEGASQVLIVSSNASAYGGDPIAQHRAAIAAAGKAGARRIVYTSHMGASAASAFPPMRHHAATETLLAESGLDWTALRNGFYAASGIALMGNAMETGVIEAPADGKVSWTAHPDLAEAAAIVLADEGRFNGPTAPLTGSQALDLDDMAAIASGLLGRTIGRKVLSEDELSAKLVARGAPPAVGAITLGLYRASRAGEFATVDPTLEALLGRKPTPLREVLATMAEWHSPA